MTKRKTQADRRRERDEAAACEWERFWERLAAARNLADALALYNQAPKDNAPGRKYYSTLGFFLLYSHFSVPHSSSAAERSFYIQLIKRMGAAGELKEVAAAKSLRMS